MGATAKVEQLTVLYPHLLASVLLQADGDKTDMDINDITNSIGCDPRFLDLDTLIKASQTISQEVRLDRLITKLLEIVIF